MGVHSVNASVHLATQSPAAAALVLMQAVLEAELLRVLHLLLLFPIFAERSEPAEPHRMDILCSSVASPSTEQITITHRQGKHVK